MEAELARWRSGEKVSSEEQIAVDMEKSMVSSVVEGKLSLCRGMVEPLFSAKTLLSICVLFVTFESCFLELPQAGSQDSRIFTCLSFYTS